MFRSLQFEISLEEIEPRIWRRVLVPEGLHFDDLHYIIQVAMGWEDCHLHTFEVGKRRLEPYDGEGSLSGAEDEAEVPLSSVFRRRGQTIRYTYDLGDSWVHRIRFEKFVSLPEPSSPRVIGGARACPREDCGGAYGYQEFLDYLESGDVAKIGPEKVEWFGDFDPACFSMDEANQHLREFDEVDEEDALDELMGIDFHYDANDMRGPDPDRWLALDEQERIMAVSRYFVLTFGDASSEVDPLPLLATVVENQFVLDSPKEVRTAVARLMEAGGTRLDAVMEIAQVLANYIEDVATADGLPDEQRYVRDLVAITKKASPIRVVRETLEEDAP